MPFDRIFSLYINANFTFSTGISMSSKLAWDSNEYILFIKKYDVLFFPERHNFLRSTSGLSLFPSSVFSTAHNFSCSLGMMTHVSGVIAKWVCISCIAVSVLIFVHLSTDGTWRKQTENFCTMVLLTNRYLQMPEWGVCSECIGPGGLFGNAVLLPVLRSCCFYMRRQIRWKRN